MQSARSIDKEAVFVAIGATELGHGTVLGLQAEYKESAPVHGYNGIGGQRGLQGSLPVRDYR